MKATSAWWIGAASMKRTIRVLAVGDLILYCLVGLSNTLLPYLLLYLLGSALGADGKPTKLCGSPSTCIHTFFFPFSSGAVTAPPPAFLTLTPSSSADTSYLLTLIVFLITVLLSVMIVTLSTMLHRRDGSQRWSTALTILTTLLVISPVTLVAGLGIGSEVMALLALVVTLIALTSTFSAGRGDSGS
jgi:hypothetical protein